MTTAVPVRRVLPLLLALLLGAAALPAQAAPAVQRVHRSWSFDGTGTGVLVLSGRVRWGATQGVYAQVAGDAPGPGRPADVTSFASVQDVGGAAGGTYGRIGRRDLCPDPVTTCRVEDGDLVFTSVFVVSGGGKGGAAAHTRFHLYLEGQRVSVQDVLVGWRRTPVGGARRVTQEQADGAGLGSGGRSSGALLSAAATGGRRGSLALAVPPCGTAGAGAAVLTGPGAQATEACPTGPFAATARRGGRWTLSGATAGVTDGRTRLLVLDL